MPSSTAISVVIPVYNRRDMLPRALESIVGQMDSEDEIIVVNDGSSDGVEEDFQEPRQQITFISQINQGRSVARNVGLEKAKNPWVIFLDSDDFFFPDAFKHFKRVAKEGQADVIVGQCQYVDLDLKLMPEETDYYISLQNEFRGATIDYEFMLIQSPAFPSVTLWQSDQVRKAGAFDPNLRLMEDYDLLWSVAALGGRYVYLEHPVSARVEHGGNTDVETFARYTQALVDKHRAKPWYDQWKSRSETHLTWWEVRAHRILNQTWQARLALMRSLINQPALLREPRYIKLAIALSVPHTLLDGAKQIAARIRR